MKVSTNPADDEVNMDANTIPRTAEYHISFTIGFKVYSHKVTGTIGGAYMHMDVLIDRAEYEVNADRARRGLESLSAHNRKVCTIERIDPVIRAHMAQARAYGQTGYKVLS